MLAHVTVARYQDALPLHRQEKILQRIGVKASANFYTLINNTPDVVSPPGEKCALTPEYSERGLS